MKHVSFHIPKEVEVKMVQSHQRWVKTYTEVQDCSGHRRQRTAHALMSRHSLCQRLCHHYIMETVLCILMDPRVFCECFSFSLGRVFLICFYKFSSATAYLQVSLQKYISEVFFMDK